MIEPDLSPVFWSGLTPGVTGVWRSRRTRLGWACLGQSGVSGCCRSGMTLISVQLMGVLIAGVAGARMSIMTTRRRKSPEQIVRL